MKALPPLALMALIIIIGLVPQCMASSIADIARVGSLGAVDQGGSR